MDLFLDIKARRICAALLLLALLWGFAEATVFFIVPDVIISLVALLYGWRAGALAVWAAIIGAVLGGAVVYYWGQADFQGALAFFDQLPAISPSTFKEAQAGLAEPQFVLQMIKGSFNSVPYKVYAAEAGTTGMALWTFMLITPIVRLPRFALAVVFARLAQRFAPAFLQTHKVKLLMLFWVTFYAFYWGLAPS